MNRFVIITVAIVLILTGYFFYNYFCLKPDQSTSNSIGELDFSIEHESYSDSSKMLFIHYCISCHSIQKDLTGPALSRFLDIRSVDWMYVFLTNRKQLVRDSLNQANLLQYKAECMEFPELTRRQVELIWNRW